MGQFKSKYNGSNFNIAVCYLLPYGSTRMISGNLLMQVAQYQNQGPFLIMGDFNARTGNEEDFITGVDNIPSRSNVDKIVNNHGQCLIDLLISANCCIVNGRIGKSDFTSVSTKGL